MSKNSNFTRKISILILSAVISLTGIIVKEADLKASIFEEPDKGVAITFTNFQGELAPPKTDGYAAGLTQATDAREFILNVTNFALGFLGLAAVLIIIYGGYINVVSAGNAESAGKGKKAIEYAVVGLLIVMASFAIVNTVLKAPSGNDNGSGVAGGTGQTIRGVAQGQRFAYLATEMQSLENQFKTSINFHNDLALTLVSYRDQLMAKYNLLKDSCKNADYCYFYTSKGLQDQALNTLIGAYEYKIKDKLLDYINSSNVIAASLENLIASKGMTVEMEKNLRKMSKDLREATVNAYNMANSQGDFCNTDCSEEKQRAIYDVFTKNLQNTPDKIFADNFSASLKESMGEIKLGLQKIKQIIGNLLVDGATGFDILISHLTIIESKNFLDETQRGEAIIEAKNAVNVFENLIDVLKNIKSVNTVLTADVTAGNAPLIVNFSTVGSSDPSGLSIQNEKIKWDLNGDGIDDPESEINKDKIYNCKQNAAIASCIFYKPGTYRTIVKINPSSSLNKLTGLNYDQEIAPGYAYLDIKVNPASTKINLSVSDQAGNVQPIIQYDEKGNITVDRASVYFTVSEAKAGINFNAEETKLSDGTSKLLGQDEAKIKWNFGVKSDFNDVLQTPTEKSLNIPQSFPEGGTYPIRFEVTDKNGVVDRKLFTLIVSEVAPRLTGVPSESGINEEVTFDGSNTTSEGKEINFNWNISRVSKPVETSFVPNLFQSAHAEADVSSATIKSSSKIRKEDNNYFNCALPDGKDDVMKCNFKRAGNYKVSMEVEDEKGQLYPVTTDLKITSNAPQAGIKYTALSKNYPGVYKLDGKSLSFDPDEKDNSNLEYNWEINPANCIVIGDASKSQDFELIASLKSPIGKPCEDLKEYSSMGEPVVKFSEKGEYTVNLLVRSKEEPENISKPVEQSINIDNLLDLNWGDMKNSVVLKTDADSEPSAPVTFKFVSTNAVSYELDFGDGTNQSEDMSKQAEVTHNYTKAGKYQTKLTVFDSENNENTITKNVFVGSGKTPVAVITAKVNGNIVEPEDYEISEDQVINNVIVVNRKDTLTFESDKSLNTDGTGRRLQFAWNINAGQKQATSKSLTYKFDEISGNEPNVITLKVTNEKDPRQSSLDQIKILVIGQTPVIRSMTATPENTDLKTPINIKLAAVGAEDPDGEILQYKWWYYLDQPGLIPSTENRMGTQITTSPNATITIGTRGVEGEKPKYKFGLEITDNDNNVVSTDSEDEAKRLNFNSPTIQVVNGPNKAPVAKFTANKTSLEVGEMVTFSSTSFDQDENGNIKEYRWDFGDGSKGENKATVTHSYKKANVNGYKVKLTVVDDNASEATSDIFKIYVDAIAQPPVAAFTVKTAVGSKVAEFTNTSTADTDAGAKIVKYSWDFDMISDANGDGLSDNDIQSGEQSPTFTYSEFKVYRAKLTVTDDQGQSKSVINFVNIKPLESVKPVTTTTPPSTTTTTSTTTGTTTSTTSGAVKSTSTSMNPIQPGTTFTDGSLKPAASTSTSTSGTTSTSSVAKTAGANLFEASTKIDPGLLVVSLLAYGILHLVAKKNKKENS